MDDSAEGACFCHPTKSQRPAEQVRGTRGLELLFIARVRRPSLLEARDDWRPYNPYPRSIQPQSERHEKKQKTFTTRAELLLMRDASHSGGMQFFA